VTWMPTYTEPRVPARAGDIHPNPRTVFAGSQRGDDTTRVLRRRIGNARALLAARFDVVRMQCVMELTEAYGRVAAISATSMRVTILCKVFLHESVYISCESTYVRPSTGRTQAGIAPNTCFPGL
jgi:hypothetical protein